MMRLWIWRICSPIFPPTRHCWNEKAANSLKAMIEAELPEVTVKIGKNLGLCSYYAERGGMLVGYEKF